MCRLPPHPNVVQFLGVGRLGADEICIVSSFVPGGSLLSYLKSDRPITLEQQVRAQQHTVGRA